ncbi:MAG: insulinase family protein [Actinomycetota bacterium]|nr:insulinase family protein [Actinomycetota bacterium]
MIKQFEVDGVPALLSPTSGPAHAGLAFRVGFADEPLSRRGITHLVEHLALHSTGGADYHYNGATGVEHTYFHMQGSSDEIAGFLTGVCASLRDLPLHRLGIEKDLLRAEENGRSRGPADQMPMWRHGATGYGTPSYPEWGLPAITEDDLRAWVARFFTRENAVLWVAGDDVPAGLRLDLPSGVRQPSPELTSTLPVTPAWFAGGSGSLVWDALAPRAARTSVFAGVLERALFRELRQEGGLSYTVHAAYDLVGADQALVTAVADAASEKHGAVLGGFVDVLNALRVGRVDEADVATVIKKQTEAISHAEEHGGRLPGQALGLLSGRPVREAEDVLTELREVTAAEVAVAAAEACGTGLLMTPRVRGDWTGAAEAPNQSGSVVEGVEYGTQDNQAERLIIGAEGISHVSEHGRATVLWADCAVVLAWPDGGCRFVGSDGIGVSFEPTLLTDGPAARQQLEPLIPAAVRVEQPARAPERIPQPEPESAAAKGERSWTYLKLIFQIPLTLLAAGVAVLLAIAPTESGADVAIQAGCVMILAGLAVYGGIIVHRNIARVR